jgi:hypothetical protein
MQNQNPNLHTLRYTISTSFILCLHINKYQSSLNRYEKLEVKPLC